MAKKSTAAETLEKARIAKAEADAAAAAAAAAAEAADAAEDGADEGSEAASGDAPEVTSEGNDDATINIQPPVLSGASNKPVPPDIKVGVFDAQDVKPEESVTINITPVPPVEEPSHPISARTRAEMEAGRAALEARKFHR